MARLEGIARTGIKRAPAGVSDGAVADDEDMDVAAVDVDEVDVEIVFNAFSHIGC